MSVSEERYEVQGGKGHLPKKASLICHTWSSCTLLPYILILCCPTALVAFLSLQLKCKPLHAHPKQAQCLYFSDNPNCAK